MLPSKASRLAGQVNTAAARLGKQSLYLVWYPAALVVIGLFGWVFSTPQVLFVEMLLGSAITGLSLLALCSGRATLRVSRLLGTGLLAGYAFGGLPKAVTALSSGDPSVLTGEFGAHSYALALCQIFCGVAVLWTLGELTMPYLVLPTLSAEQTRRLKVFSWLGTAAVVLAFAHGDLSLMGTFTQATDGGLNIVGDFAFWLLFPLAAVTADHFAGATSMKPRTIYGCLLAIQLICIAPTGRRYFMYALLLVFTIYCRQRPTFARSPAKIALTLVSGGVLIYVMWTAFLYMRYATYTLAEGETPYIGELVERAWLIYTVGTGATSSGEGLSVQALWSDTDVEDRTNIIQYNMILLDAASRRPPAHGAGFVNEVKVTIPHVLWPDKNIVEEEELANQQFGLSMPDEANSIFSAATLDFGFWGGLWYPFLLAWLLVFSQKLCTYLPAPASTLSAYSLITLCMYTECELSVYLGIIRANLLYACIIALLLILVAPFRISKPHSRMEELASR